MRGKDAGGKWSRRQGLLHRQGECRDTQYLFLAAEANLNRKLKDSMKELLAHAAAQKCDVPGEERASSRVTAESRRRPAGKHVRALQDKRRGTLCIA